MNRIQILNSTIENLYILEILAMVKEKYIGGQVHHVVVYTGKVVAMQKEKDQELCHSVNQCHIINADGNPWFGPHDFYGNPLKNALRE